ncbi:MAG: Fe-S protein assembly co-chaperone HscB [Moraxellaceae bacterium]
MNFFEFFGLKTDPVLDQAALAARYRERQQQYHPDVGGFDAAEALQLSTLVNQAYDTLRLPDRRAAHLLALHGQAHGLEQSIHDMDFLQNAIELREQLDEVRSAIELVSLRLELQQWLEALCREFQIDWMEQDWAEARDTARKLAFIQKVLADLDRIEDRFDDLDDQLADDFNDDF